MLNIGAGVGDRDLPRHPIAVVGELAANPLLMRVEHVAQHQFAAGVDEFDVHAEQSVLFPVSGFKAGIARAAVPVQEIHP